MAHEQKARRRRSARTSSPCSTWRRNDAALRQRGEITLWFSDNAVDAWLAGKSHTPGRPQIYSDLAIETGLTVRAKASPSSAAVCRSLAGQRPSPRCRRRRQGTGAREVPEDEVRLGAARGVTRPSGSTAGIQSFGFKEGRGHVRPGETMRGRKEKAEGPVEERRDGEPGKPGSKKAGAEAGEPRTSIGSTTRQGIQRARRSRCGSSRIG